MIGLKITKKTITKAVPVVGGVVSAGLTYVTFRPMGHRLADTLVKNLNGDCADDLDFSPQFIANLDAQVVDAEVVTEDSAE